LQFGPFHVGKIAVTETANGAPQPMKMGTIVSPWRYDAAVRHSLQSANLRRPTISRYGS
jgi:hypothetical protein